MTEKEKRKLSKKLLAKYHEYDRIYYIEHKEKKLAYRKNNLERCRENDRKRYWRKKELLNSNQQ